MSNITQEPSKEEFALGSFLSAMHESKMDGRAMRAAMLKALGMDGAAIAQPDCRTCNNLDSCKEDAKWMRNYCTNGNRYVEAPKVVLWRTE